jgi:Ca2+-binding EF-hand superfamily protein
MTPRNQSIPRRRPLTSEELADAQEHFHECDLDGDHRIDFTEYSNLLDRLGVEMPSAQRRRRFDTIDTNRDGAIELTEFVAWWRSSGA